jgi:hypothetical protein
LKTCHPFFTRKKNGEFKSHLLQHSSKGLDMNDETSWQNNLREAYGKVYPNDLQCFVLLYEFIFFDKEIQTIYSKEAY